MALLAVQDLSLGHGSRTITGSLGFSVDAGGCLCVVGENGSGKTKRMKTLLRLQEPMGGQILSGDGLRRNDRKAVGHRAG